MGARVLTRAAAIGVALGVLGAAAIAARSPELLARPGAILLLAGPVVAVYLGLAGAVTLVLAGLDALLARRSGRPGALVSGMLLWTLAAVGIALGAINDAARLSHVVEPWKPVLRGLLLVLAVAALLRALSRRARGGPVRVAGFERALAWLALPALVLAALFVIRGSAPAARTTGSAAAVSSAEILALAPRFAAEPAGSLGGVRVPASPRVMLIGLDGADWSRIDRGIAEGRLPTFRRLVEGGRRASLATLYPTYSPSIWNSVATGAAPREHGIEDFYLTQIPRLDLERVRIPRSMDAVEDSLDALGALRRVPVTSSLRRRKAVWNLADEAGLRSVVIGWWASWPPEALKHGIVVSDHASLARRHEWLDRGKTSMLTSGDTTWPPALEADLAALQRDPAGVTREELAGFLPVDDALWAEFESVRVFSKRVKLSAFRSSHLNDAFHFAAARLLWERERPDLLLVYGRAIDELSHFFLEAGVPEAAEIGVPAEEIERYAGVVDRAYEWTDREIALLVEAVDRDGALLLVVSDHGWEKERDGGWNHSFAPPGILIAYGAGVCRSGCPPFAEPSVLDLAPTLLERLGLPVSRELPGQPLVEAFVEARPLGEVARYGPALSEARGVVSEADPQLQEKLEALGYVE
jgi:hypothetical protein